MKVNIDKKKCIGCGACVAICDSVFELKDGKANAKKPETDQECAKEAASSCPVNAISVK
ncbi:MAG: ferredoxin [Candidatus Pacearchaeota archaeon]